MFLKLQIHVPFCTIQVTCCDKQVIICDLHIPSCSLQITCCVGHFPSPKLEATNFNAFLICFKKHGNLVHYLHF
jgi:hypothetical protein